MAVNWGMANEGQYDYLGSLQALGQERSRDLTNQTASHKLIALGRQDAARPGIQQQLTQGDYAGASSAALGVGDYDLSGAIGKMSDGHRKEAAAQADYMGRAAMALKQMPPEARPAGYAAMAGHLKSIGFGGHELDAVTDFSDTSLDGYISLSQSVKDHIAGDLSQARIDDIGFDNDRADTLADNTIRNTDDMIHGRAASRDLTARGQDMADARGRFGISLSHQDRIRGQNVTDARARYGIDVSHQDRARGQDLVDRRGVRHQSKGSPSTGNIPVVNTPEEAHRLPPGTVFKNPEGRVYTR